MKQLYFLLFLALTFAACKKETETPPVDTTRSYFPLSAGHYITYQSDSVIWDDFKRSVDTTTSFIRYTVADTFRDLSNNLSYHILVDTRPVDTANWSYHSTFYVTPLPGALDYVQNNMRIRKLIFPVAEGSMWDGNSQVPTSEGELQYYSGWQYQYTNTGRGYDNGLRNFDNTVSVPQADAVTGDDIASPGDYADRTFSKEVYALGVGLVHRQLTHWVYDRNISTQQFYRKGYQINMRAIDFD